MRASVVLFLAPLLAFLLSGCAPADPLDTPVKSHTTGVFLMWRGKIEQRLTPAERAEFAEALREFKIAAMREAGTSAVTDFDARVRTRIDGLTLREIYIEACNARLARLRPEGEELRRALAHNHQIGGSDQRSADFIAVRIERQTERLAVIDAQLAAAEARLRELGAPIPVSP